MNTGDAIDKIFEDTRSLVAVEPDAMRTSPSGSIAFAFEFRVSVSGRMVNGPVEIEAKIEAEVKTEVEVEAEVELLIEIAVEIEVELEVDITWLGGASSWESISLFDKSTESELEVETTLLAGASP